VTANVSDLIRRHRTGDTTAGPAIVRAYLPVVRSLALAGTLDPTRAAEVTGRVLGRLLSRAGEARDASRLLALAEEGARDEVRQEVKGSGGRRAYLLTLADSPAARPSGPGMRLPEVLGGHPTDRTAWMLLEAASFLPAHSQAMFLLRYLEGLGYPEIADLAGVSAREVGAAIGAARRLFERELDLYLRKLAKP
jgi:DNA-directed RNA polymerase specialized sigma24 family protein